MPPFKDPSFQERVSRAAAAKDKALQQLREKPPVDPAVLAERAAARSARDQAEAEKRAARKAEQEQAKAAREQAKAEKAAAAEQAKAATAKRVVVLPTEAERKAARDARYAARKARQ